jgi:hypothetical protein
MDGIMTYERETTEDFVARCKDLSPLDQEAELYKRHCHDVLELINSRSAIKRIYEYLLAEMGKCNALQN